MPESAVEIFERLGRALERDDRDGTLREIRAGYELLNREGVSAWLDLFDPEIEWSEGTEVPERRVYVGREGVLKQQDDFEQAWESFRMEPVDFAAARDRIAVIVDAWGRGRESGVEVTARVGHLFEMRDGKVVRFLIYGDPAKAIEAALSG